jgi:hypothetical protein
VYEAATIVGTCINCVASASLTTTLVVLLIGAGIALRVERRKFCRAKA